MADIDALGKLKIGIAHIVHKYPLFGGLIASWTIREMAEVGTMGVGVGERGIDLLYAPDFVNAISISGLVAVLHHEVRHEFISKMPVRGS